MEDAGVYTCVFAILKRNAIVAVCLVIFLSLQTEFVKMRT